MCPHNTTSPNICPACRYLLLQVVTAHRTRRLREKQYRDTQVARLRAKAEAVRVLAKRDLERFERS